MSSASAAGQLPFFQDILISFRHWQCLQAEAVGKYCLTSAARARAASFLPKSSLSTLQQSRLGALGKCGHKTLATKANCQRGSRPWNPQAAWPHMRLEAAGTRKRGASAIAARSTTIRNSANWNCFPACAE